MEHESLSDHRIINFTFRGQGTHETKLCRPYRKAKWTYFQELLGRLDSNTIAVDTALSSAEELALWIHDELKEALDVAVPLRKIELDKKCGWWNTSLSATRAELKKLYRKRNLHNQAQSEYKNMRNTYNREIIQSKQKSWRDFCTKAESAKDIAKLIQIIDNPPQRLMSVLHKDGEVLEDQGSLEQILK